MMVLDISVLFFIVDIRAQFLCLLPLYHKKQSHYVIVMRKNFFLWKEQILLFESATYVQEGAKFAMQVSCEIWYLQPY